MEPTVTREYIRKVDGKRGGLHNITEDEAADVASFEVHFDVDGITTKVTISVTPRPRVKEAWAVLTEVAEFAFLRVDDLSGE